MEEITDYKKSAVKSKWIMLSLGMLIVLLAVLVGVMFFDCAAERVGNLLGTKGEKKETIQFIGWAISGVFVAIGLAVLGQRADAQMRTATAQADAAKAQADAAKAQAGATKAQVENNRLVEKGHTQERFKTATEHLGHENASVRISAFYEFVHFIKDNGEEYRKSILDILYAHMRATTTDFESSEYVKEARRKNKRIKTTEEIQGLLDILFKSQDIDRSDIKPNLQRVYFSEADLSNADLSKVNLSGANLFGAKLNRTNLSEAMLSGANLSRAMLFHANLSGAVLFGAQLIQADLSEAILSEAILSDANLSGANLSGANLVKVSLLGADLSGANLSRANFSEVHLGGVKYTNKTQFPEWFVLPIVPPANGDEVRAPLMFFAPEKPEDNE